MSEGIDMQSGHKPSAVNLTEAAALLINMGGPENPDEVRPFIRSLFSDPCIMQVPGPIRAALAIMLSRLRASNVRRHYQAIGGKSPLKALTSSQAKKVADKLAAKYPNLSVQAAYSYSHPRIIEAVAQLSRRKYDRIIAVPMYPHYSRATRGSVYRELDIAVRKYGIGETVRTVAPFYEHPLYIEATVDLLQRALSDIDLNRPFRVIFTAHSLPQSYIDGGDPYREQIERTIAVVTEKFPLENHVTSYQSKVGPVKWMQPSTTDTIRETAKMGLRQVVVMPIGFVCDHLETLYELDMELAEIARDAGITNFVRGQVFNDHE
ncbi:MAG: ferrochelatase, partial [Candidatus Zixiibacteriota bacterium]